MSKNIDPLKWNAEEPSNLYEVNSKLLKILKQIVNKEIRKECRKDALYILQNCNEKTVMEFLFFGLSGNGNLTCTCLDFAKSKITGKPIKTEQFGNFKF